MAHPTVLKTLIERYETLLPQAEDGSAEARRRMEDLTYTLCVSTGTRHIDAALDAARRQLSGSGSASASASASASESGFVLAR